MTAATALPSPLPAHTWVSYRVHWRADGAEVVLEERTYHSPRALARAVLRRHVSTEETPGRGGDSHHSVLVYYGVGGAVVEPVETLAALLPSFGATPVEESAAFRYVLTAIESWGHTR